MAQHFTIPMVVCKHCSSPPLQILVPYPTLAGIFQPPPAWPRDIWKKYFLCHECGHVSEYSAKDVHWGVLPVPDRNQFPIPPIFFQIEIECAEASCENPIRIFTYRGIMLSIGAIIESVPGGESWEKTVCSNGHAPATEPGLNYFEIFGPAE